MAKTKATAEANGATGMRRCIGSERFGIEAHDAPVEDFPAQPSQKDGLGRMCKPHWRQYTAALSKAARERKAAAGEAAPEAEPAPEAIEPAEVDNAAEPMVAKAKPTKRASAKSRATPATGAPAPDNGLGAWRTEHGTEE